MPKNRTSPDTHFVLAPEHKPWPVDPTGAGPDRLEWGDALEAAAARLIETALEHDNLAHMEQSVMANELAAQLCAYGLAMGEVEHKLVHDAEELENLLTPRLVLLP
jgi:hypothetical protein